MFTTFKRWTLKNGFHESEVAALVQGAILPAYRKLSGCLGIGLLRIEGTSSYLATQYWQSRAARDTDFHLRPIGCGGLPIFPCSNNGMKG